MMENSKKYDLEERTAKFGENVITFCARLPNNSILSPLINQLVRSATSVGANYCEATEAESRKDIINKIGLSKKEVKETKHWLRLLAKSNSEKKEDIRKLWKEAHELLLISSKIIKSSKSKRVEN